MEIFARLFRIAKSFDMQNVALVWCVLFLLMHLFVRIFGSPPLAESPNMLSALNLGDLLLWMSNCTHSGVFVRF